MIQINLGKKSLHKNGWKCDPRTQVDVDPVRSGFSHRQHDPLLLTRSAGQVCGAPSISPPIALKSRFYPYIKSDLWLNLLFMKIYIFVVEENLCDLVDMALRILVGSGADCLPFLREKIADQLGMIFFQ